MNGPRHGRSRSLQALQAALAVLIVLAIGCAQASAAETKVSPQAFQEQLSGGAIRSATINKRIRWAHLVLKDGRHVAYVYPTHQASRIIAELKAKHVQVKVESKAEAKKDAKQHRHVSHKLRYIVGGAVIAVIVIAIGVFIFVRRRRRE